MTDIPARDEQSSGMDRVAAIIRDAGLSPPAADGLSRQDDVAGERGSESSAAGPRACGFDVDLMNEEWCLVLMGSKAVIVREQDGGPIEDRLRILGLEAFGAWFGNTYTEVRGTDGKVKGSTWAKRWLAHPKRRSYGGIEFFPSPENLPCTPGYLNLWRGFAVEARSGGSYGILRDHMLNNVCDGDMKLYTWLFAWFAHLLQRPRERVGTAVVMRGKMGTGKTKVGEVMGSLIRAHYFAVDDPRYVTGQFNAHMASCLLLQAEEAVWAGDKAAEGRLKGLVTSKFQMIEAKGIDPIRIDNHVRLLMTSNEDWVIPAGKDERRFCVLDINPRCAQNTDYFREMDEQLDAGGREALLYDLLHFDLSQVDLRKIPRTQALLEQKIRSLDSVESWWLERLESGVTTTGGDGWRTEMPVQAFFDDYIAVADKVGVRRKNEMIAFGIKMKKLIPGLDKSRPWMDMNGVMKRPWCYVLPSLQVCRDAFETELGQPLVWPAEASPNDDYQPRERPGFEG